MEPLDQIDQAPAHNGMDGRDRAAFDNIDQCLALSIVKPRTGAGCLATKQAVRATGIEPQHPVPHNLKADTTDPRRRTPAPAIVNLGQCQKRRAWFTCFVVRDNRRSDAPSKSSREPIAVPMPPFSNLKAPLSQISAALGFPP
ncbi:hypothetical protein JI59_19905 (plasmid) [Novosphingobium pentaromativorans US6-1]|nr:hypothetical protein [Novosphingobium pentaromativorans]AIT81852.1 hypothetical protein JI59_19905 [Novosphingobium pentaromativorans US6-1]